jgi:hypothetical protein
MRKIANDQDEIVIVDETNEGFTLVGKWILDLQIRSTPKMVFIALKSFAGYSEIRPSIRTVARRAGCSRSTTKRSIQILEQKKLVHVMMGKRPDGGTGANIYVLQNPDKDPLIQIEPGVNLNLAQVHEEPGARSTVNLQYYKHNNIKKHNSARVCGESLNEILTGVFSKIDRTWLQSLIQKSKRPAKDVARDIDRLCWQYQRSQEKVRTPEALIRQAIKEGWAEPSEYIPLDERKRRIRESEAVSSLAKAREHAHEDEQERLWAAATERFRKLPDSEKKEYIERYPWLSSERREAAAIGQYMREMSLG